MGLRRMSFNGVLYEADFGALSERLKNAFKQGPGDLPRNSRKRFCRGFLVPNLHTNFSAECSAWAYDEIGESMFPDYFVILGTNTRSEENLVNLDDWETPFGVIKNAGKNLGLKEDDFSAASSIELQLPFLQFVNRDKLAEIKVIPILIGKYDEALCSKIRNLSGSKVVICASNLFYYGAEYSNVPFIYSKKDNFEEVNKNIVNLILSKNIEEFGKIGRKFKSRDIDCISTLMKCLRDSRESRLLNISSTGKLMDDYNNSIGFASVLFS